MHLSSPLRLSLLLLSTSALALASCKDKGGADSGADADGGATPVGCGDGELADDEECDDGAANSDTAPDACRSTCLLPACGDGVADSDEACDDGNAVGGDGCTPACTAEEGALETEPNDSAASAEVPAGFPVHGSLSEGDVDCFAVDVPDCASIEAALLDPCDTPATLSLYGSDDTLRATGSPGLEDCPVLSPVEVEGARFLDEGSAAVCVEGILGAAVPAYTLDLALVPAEEAEWSLPDDEDPDGDGLPARCDDDDDGDGILDEEDSCPEVENAGEELLLFPDGDGLISDWLAAGPFDGRSSPADCLPTEDALVAGDLGDDGLVRPSLADPVGDSEDLTWAWFRGDERNDLTAFMTVDAPREIYLLTYVYSETEQSLTLALGPDDGAKAWLGGEVVLEITGCQGTTLDQYQAAVTLQAGWQPLMVKIHDQGGGWGSYVRFLDGDGAPVTDLTLSLSSDGIFAPGQEDSDGDGDGDACDPTP